MASVCGYRASAIMAEMEVEPNAVIIKKEEVEEEKVDAFGRLIGRKAAVLENKRRSKCVEGLGDRELKRRKRLEQWCSKLGVLPLPPADFNSYTNNQSTTTSINRQNIDSIGSIGIQKIKQEGGLLTSNISSDSRTPDIVIKSEVKDENGIDSDAKRISSQDNSTLGGVKRDHTSAVAGLGLGLGLGSDAQGREEELDQYYNPKKASRAGLGMGGLGSAPSSSSSSSFTKGSIKCGGSSSVVTPFLSSFVKASAPAPAPSPSTVPALVPPPPVFVPPPVFDSNRSNINRSNINSSSSNGSSNSSSNSSSSSSNSSSNGASDSSTSSVPSRPALSYADCLVEYERAVVLSGLESIPLGDSCDLDDSELLGESLNTLYFSSLLSL